MKKFAAILLCVCLLLTALPVYASAAEGSGSAVGYVDSGATGDCTWSYDTDTCVLTISGEGAMANYYDSTKVPWFQNQGRITGVVVEHGVTHIGSSAFAWLRGVNSVSLPYSLTSIGDSAFAHSGLGAVTIPDQVTDIGASAFEECNDLTGVIFPKSLVNVGIKAFLGTKVTYVFVPNKETQLGRFSIGYDANGNKTPGFALGGEAKSAANTYANINGFEYRTVDLNSTPHAVEVHMGRAYSSLRNMVVTSAYANEFLQIQPHPEPYFNLTGYESHDAELYQIGSDWCFSMPGISAEIFVEGDYYDALTIDFSLNARMPVTAKEYECLNTALSSFLIQSMGNYKYYDLDRSGKADVATVRDTGSADVPYYAQKLTTCSLTSSIALNTTDDKLNPICFIFADNTIREAELYLSMPQAGDSYDYTKGADVTPSFDSDFTVESAYWYNEWGVAAPTFVAGDRYFVEMVLVPNEGYAFRSDCRIMMHGAPELAFTPAKAYRLDTSGRLHVYTDMLYIPGEAHAIHVNGGMAAQYEGEHASYRKLNEARAGEIVWVSVGTDDIADDEFVVQGTTRYYSDQVIFHGEAGQYFVMPNEEVYVDVFYEKRKQSNCVMDLSNGQVYHATPYGDTFEEHVTSQLYGIQMLLEETCEYDWDYDSEYGRTMFRYDIDGTGTYDVACVGNEFFLLPTSTLSAPSGRVTLKLSREDSTNLPVRSVTIIFAEPTVQKHRITVIGGTATTKAGDYKGEYRVYEAYPGEGVYVLPDPADLGEYGYAVQHTIESWSDDVEIYSEGDTNFIMPDRDITVYMTYEKGVQTNGVMDLSGGSYTPAKTEPHASSEAYGMYFIMQELCARVHNEYNEQTLNLTQFYDVDDFGGYDISYDRSTGAFTLLDTNSLRPASGRVTLTLPRDGYYTVPMRSVTILLENDPERQTPHRITVTNGFASSVIDSHDYHITEQYPGEVVYILSDPAAVPEGQYLKGREVTSEDVEITEDMGYWFVMPNKEVNVDVKLTIEPQSPCTLDFSASDYVYINDAELFNSIGGCLGYASKQQKQEYDEELHQWVRLFDLDGNGTYDIRQDYDDKSFYRIRHENSGAQTLALPHEEAILLQYYPLTIIFSGYSIKGDVNNDGRVDIADATALQRFLAEFSDAWLDLSVDSIMYAADANSDGVVNVYDVTHIQRYLAYMIKTL